MPLPPRRVKSPVPRHLQNYERPSRKAVCQWTFSFANAFSSSNKQVIFKIDNAQFDLDIGAKLDITIGFFIQCIFFPLRGQYIFMTYIASPDT